MACAHFGASVVGADIDYKLLHGIGWYAADESSTLYDESSTLYLSLLPYLTLVTER